MIEAIVATYLDWGIGCNGTQPIVLKKDREWFRKITDNAAVIVGRKTFMDFSGGKPLKNRKNIVLTKQDIEIEGAYVAHSVEEALKLAEGYEHVFVIGGESIYNLFLPMIERIYVTQIWLMPKSDSYFPNLFENEGLEFSRIARSEMLMEDNISYFFTIWERVKKIEVS